MRPTTIVLFYWWRLRIQPLQELLAATGIAAGVALLFAVQVSNSSIGGSVEQLVHGLTGQFTLQLASRDTRGFSEALTAKVRKIDGVRIAAPLLEQHVGITGSHGHSNVSLVGVTDAIASANGPLLDGFGGRFGLRLAPALLLPKALADHLGARRDGFVTLATRRPLSLRVPVSATLDRSQIGEAIDSPLVVAPLFYVQKLVGLPQRVTRILVAVRPGTEAQVRQALRTLAAGRLAVQRSDVEIAYVDQAAAPNNQSTSLFAGICAIVGILLTFTAMLLTLPERRRFADLRMQGYKRHQILASIVFEAAALGVIASAVGLVLGDQLVRHIFHSAPGYLSFAFPVGGQRIVEFPDVLIAFASGIGATFIGATPLIRELFSPDPTGSVPPDAERIDVIGTRERVKLAGVGAALLIGVAVLVVLVPQATLLCVLLLALAMLALLPALLAGMLLLVDRLIDGMRGRSFPIAVMELGASLTRATALAATAALAVFGTVAINGAHRDLLHGLDTTAASLLGTTDVWVTAAGDENILMTTPFRQPNSQVLLATGVASDVRAYRGEFLDMAGRRVWIMARPPTDRTLIPPSEIHEGNRDRATQLIRSGGWAAISASIADRLDVRVGDRFTIPTPAGLRKLHVAAVVSNLGWTSGSVVLNGNDYQRWWPGSDVTALEVDLRSGVTPDAGAATIREALPASTPLVVETSAERQARFSRLERQGLSRLSQISTLLMLAAVLAMAAAMAGTVWQQRRRLAALRMQGYSVGCVLRVLLAQAVLVLAPGAALGAALGLCGQALATRWLVRATGFPTSGDVSVGLATTVCVAAALVGLVVVAIPGYLAARTQPRFAFHVD